MPSRHRVSFDSRVGKGFDMEVNEFDFATTARGLRKGRSQITHWR
jgi:hypothetical protein